VINYKFSGVYISNSLPLKPEIKPNKFYTFGTLAGEIFMDRCRRDGNSRLIYKFYKIFNSYTYKLKQLKAMKFNDEYMLTLLRDETIKTCIKMLGHKEYSTYAINCVKTAYKKYLEQ